MLGLFILLFHGLGLISSLHALMSTRTSQGTIAWLVALNTFPYISVPAYWILGRSRFQGYVKARQTAEDKTQRFVKELSEALTPFRISSDTLPPSLLAGHPAANEGLSRHLTVFGDAG